MPKKSVLAFLAHYVGLLTFKGLFTTLFDAEHPQEENLPPRKQYE
jgi:hypothetical protein